MKHEIVTGDNPLFREPVHRVSCALRSDCAFKSNVEWWCGERICESLGQPVVLVRKKRGERP